MIANMLMDQQDFKSLSKGLKFKFGTDHFYKGKEGDFLILKLSPSFFSHSEGHSTAR